MRPSVLLALVTVGFAAAAIFALGMISLFTERDVIAVKGLGVLPGAVGFAAAVCAFAALLAPVLAAGHPRYTSALWVALAAGAVHLLAVWTAALLVGASLPTATAAAGDLIAGWSTPALALCAFVAAWAGIAIRRTRARPPRWPWERDTPSSDE